MSHFKRAKWTDGKRTVEGEWIYVWSRDRFIIQLDGKDDLGRRREKFEVSGDEPEWGNWKLVEETPKKLKPSRTRKEGGQ